MSSQYGSYVHKTSRLTLLLFPRRQSSQNDGRKVFLHSGECDPPTKVRNLACLLVGEVVNVSVKQRAYCRTFSFHFLVSSARKAHNSETRTIDDRHPIVSSTDRCHPLSTEYRLAISRPLLFISINQFLPLSCPLPPQPIAAFVWSLVFPQNGSGRHIRRRVATRRTAWLLFVRLVWRHPPHNLFGAT